MSHTVKQDFNKQDCYDNKISNKARVSLLVLLACCCASACVNNRSYDPSGERSVSIPYDPYNFDPERLDEEAQAHCDAFNLRAVYEDETIDNQSVRWRYRHYVCV